MVGKSYLWATKQEIQELATESQCVPGKEGGVNSSLKNSPGQRRGGKIKGELEWHNNIVYSLLRSEQLTLPKALLCPDTLRYYFSAISANIAILNTLCHILICPAGCKLLISSHFETVKNKTIAFATWEMAGNAYELCYLLKLSSVLYQCSWK